MNSIFKRPILVFSNYCKYSLEYVNALSEFNLIDDFVLVNVDIQKDTKQRSSDFVNLKKILKEQYQYDLKSVPTIIVENGELILSDSDAFDWLRFTINTLNNSKTHNEVKHDNIPINNIPIIDNNDNRQKQQSETDLITGFNQNEMFSFSDQYSTFGENESNPKQQSFQFISGDNNFISTPTDSNGSFKKTNKNVKFQIDDFDQKNTKNKTYGTEKEKEMTSKYDEMMKERQMMDQKFSAPERV